LQSAIKISEKNHIIRQKLGPFFISNKHEANVAGEKYIKNQLLNLAVDQISCGVQL
jgi:hypothetical protein